MQKIRETFMVVLLLLFLSTLGFGQEMRVTETILPNGLKVLLKEEHKSPVVTFQF